MSFLIKYYGVRGSTPTPGADFVRYGGNTTCVFIEVDGHKIIIDAGTGIRQLGMDLMAREFGSNGGKCLILFSHTHWDHIQGLPFFIPIYLPQNEFDIYGQTKTIPLSEKDRHTWTIKDVLSMQQNFMYFPVSTKDLASTLNFHEIEPGKKMQIGNLEIRAKELRHPNTSLGFRFNFGGKSYVFCTDIEHSPEEIKVIADFARDADVMAYDCQYTPEEYEKSKIGWGHSTYGAAAEIAKLGNVKQVHMIHHDPVHTDARLDELEKKAQEVFPAMKMIPEGFSFQI